jgi:hypothetical protein
MTFIALTLRRSIEDWAESMRRDNPLGPLARSGQFTPQALALYLESLRYMFQQSQLNLALAAKRCDALGLSELAAYFQRKAHEEQGHDGWAANDLARLAGSPGSTGAVHSELRPAASVVRLVELQRELIDQHPLCFAAYALWAEYFTVLLGDEWLDALSAGGYQRGQLSAVAKHVEADREHAAIGFSEIERMWHGEPSAPLLMAAVERAERAFELFCHEIYSAAACAA